MVAYKIPDLLRNWPWQRQLSPFYEEAKKESSAWVTSFRPFAAKGQKAFDACDLNLLASLTYSSRNQEFVRAGCDLMNFYFVYDEYTDVCGPEIASQLAKLVLDVMQNPYHTQTNRHLLGQMTEQFWKRAQTLASPESSCFKHFISTSAAYFDAVTQEAQDRKDRTIRSVKEYLPLRRDSCGARPTLALIEFGLDLPDEVMEHPTIVSLTTMAVDLIVLVNDMHSYVREISCGLADHNFISVIMNEYNVDLQSAFNWLGDYTDGLVVQFFAEMKQVPSWGPQVDERVQEYINGLGQWVRGNDDWSCEAKRYHGDDGLKIRDQRVVYVCPRIANYVQKEEVTQNVPPISSESDDPVQGGLQRSVKLDFLWSKALQWTRRMTNRSWILKT